MHQLLSSLIPRAALCLASLLVLLTYAPAAPAEEASAPAGDSAPEPGKQRNNLVYLELGGPGIIYSVNYERRIADFNIRVGAGGAAFNGAGYFIAPVGFNYIGLGDEKHHLELGVTANLGFSGVAAVGSVPGSSAFFASFSPIVGYRLQPRTGGFVLRAGLSPIIGATTAGVAAFGFLPLPYVSFGAAF